MNAQELFEARMREKTAQVRVKKGYIVDGHSSGTIFYTTPSRARVFMDQGAVELIGGNVPGPTTQPVAGPMYAKQSSSEVPTGPSTDSATSGESGKDEPLSASEEDQASHESSARSLSKLSEKIGAALSRSTTRTSSRRSRT